jgi:ATP-dependent Clp protease ATP-binding subunit ClpC
VGYDEGGQLTEIVRRRPYQVILFDEIEKAHADVWNALLQIMEEGQLTDGHGRTVDFRNTVIIMTSNIGTRFAGHGGALGFQTKSSSGEDKEFVDDISQSLKRTFRPEFLNRVDEIIIFHKLTRENMVQIVDLQMQDIEERLVERGIHIELSQAAKGWLADEGYDPAFGARPLRRALQRHVESPLSQKLLEGQLADGDTVLGDLSKDSKGLTFSTQTAEEKVDTEDETVEKEAEPASVAGA